MIDIRRLRGIPLAVALVAGLTLLAGCGSPERDTSSTTVTDQTTTMPPPVSSTTTTTMQQTQP